GKVEITLDGDEEHPLLKKIVSDGTALVTGEKGQKLLCPGKVLFIPGQRRLEAKAYEGKEIAFEDRTGKFQADYARLQFAEPIAELKVDKAMLKGRVRLSGLVFLPESFSQVALADEVRLDVPAKKAIFKSSEIQPVLYFDPQQNVQISAPKVVASLKEDGTVSAQGKGTVRFKFTGAELDLLRLPGK
ncbi:MAG: hypothetical protein KDK48_04905, partial [Chlamydiia bacterium]|nr:hypothetical protein [Chlamydiia bacterium]